MINLYFDYTSFGPGKVVKNLISGLNKIKYPHRINPDNSAVNLEEDYFLCLQDVQFLNQNRPKNLIIGPNICVLPFDNRVVISQNYNLHLVPCKWVFDYFSKWINPEKLNIWPVGIDTDNFQPLPHSITKDCLIYFKRRNEIELAKTTKILKKFNQTFDILPYGNYSEEDFIKKISSVKYVFLLNGTESQGIAVQEILSCNKPIFCWDVSYWNDRGKEYEFPATSVPYWSDIVGIKTTEENKIEEYFSEFLNRLLTFSPREYILENLTLEKQARELILKFNH